MFRDIVLQDTRPEEWPAIRERIRARFLGSLGAAPTQQSAAPTQQSAAPTRPLAAPDTAPTPHYEVADEYERYGLRHVKIRYRTVTEDDGLAVLVLPSGASESSPAHAVVVCHGTYGGKLGKNGPLSLEGPECGYAVELAQRGFVGVAPDNYEFGERVTRGRPMPEDEVNRRYIESMARFEKEHPEWSLDGRRIWDHQRLLDVLDGISYVRHGRYGVMGNSLGGRMAIFLAAVDERIAAAVPSCGISPNLTNVYRVLSGSPADRSSPRWIEHLRRTGGHMLYDYQDVIALCAPRPLLVIEPFNDAYNPYVEADFQCFVKGQRAYALLGRPECFCTLTHGDGHATLDDVREFAYSWFRRWLGAGGKA